MSRSHQTITKMWAARPLGILFSILVLCPACLCVSTYMGIQPGKSTRADVERILGGPVQSVGPNVIEYGVAGGSGKLFVEYRADSIVDRLDRRFARPVSRAAMIRSLGLPEPDESGRNKEGKFVEYFGDVNTLAFVYAGQEAKSGVLTVGYYSMEMYARSLDTARNPVVQFDPTTCRDLYFWSQTEREPAKRSKNVGRLQTILEIGILSQRGECEKARFLADGYKKQYQ